MAPDFEAPTPAGGVVRLSTLLGGGPLVLIFTGDPGHLAPFERLRGRFRRAGARLLAVVAGDPRRVALAVRLWRLGFTVAADPGGRVASLYGAVRRLGPLVRVETVVYLVSGRGVVEEVFRGLRPEELALAALEAVEGRV